jgi:hypothetical protein
MIVTPDYVSSWGDAVLYGEPDQDWRGRGLGFLESIGYSLTRPGSPTVAVTEGGECAGEGTEMSTEDFLRRLHHEESLSFRIWSRSRDDMFCTFRRLPCGWMESYTIGGAVREEAEAFAARLLQRFVEETAARERMLVIDWAAAAEFDWDELWAGHATYTGAMPDLVGVPDRLRSRFQPSGTSESLPGPQGHALLRRVC